eukprot:Protomagalhaensia_wolfi_Nauph_80__5992@NODE_811_length_1982_cov_13_032424_g608_i0_p2_GENE_NODE_811_length_1982_cov_13_032424_g608_i0NODE_811_length_1982_cov_13_032424_g608_i0_p2_ORF_typecomplete_len199_score22_56AA_kinase/PF00696_28/0_0026_NODE_811_length_1982_cov_13_032424_g608_i027623
MASGFPADAPTDADEIPAALLDSPAWWVWKFGGSSVASYERMLQVTKLVCDQLEQWEAEPGSVTSHDRYSFLASSPSPTLSRMNSQATASHVSPRVVASPRSLPLATDHLAVVSSAVSGVTDLLSGAVHRALDARNGRGEESPGVGGRFRAAFLNETEKELQSSAEALPLMTQLETCCFSHTFGDPILVRAPVYPVEP